MFKEFRNYIWRFLFPSISSENKNELNEGINQVNIVRGKYTASAFIVIEILILVISCIIKGTNVLQKPSVYYLVLYLIMLLGMILYLMIFKRLDKNILKYHKEINFFGAVFALFILLCSACISLLDQHSSGQITVYTVAIIAVAVTPIYKPITLLCIYTGVQAAFLILMTYFQKSGEIIYSNYINSTAFVIISWVISCMRYRKQIEEFINKKLLKKKSDELLRLNNELKEINRKLDVLSQTDALTNVYNRLGFDKRIKEDWERCKHGGMPLTLIIIDIDYFKKINDNFGHQAGDDCIRQVAAILSANVNESFDFVARYGGDEFAVLLTNKSREKAAELAEQLRKRVELMSDPFSRSFVLRHITISLGVCSVIPTDAVGINEFIRIADNALYQAKKNRNNLVVA